MRIAKLDAIVFAGRLQLKDLVWNGLEQILQHTADFWAEVMTFTYFVRDHI